MDTIELIAKIVNLYEQRIHELDIKLLNMELEFEEMARSLKEKDYELEAAKNGQQ